MIDFKSLKHMPTVKIAMTTFPYAIDIDSTADKAWAMMLEHQIRHLPVTSEGDLVGIVTERDLRLVLRPGGKPGEVSLRSTCETEVYVVSDDTPLNHVAREMGDRQVGSALVARHGKLVGIVTGTDVCRLLADLLEVRFAHDHLSSGTPRADEPA